MAGARFLFGIGAALVFASPSAVAAEPSAADKETSRDLYAEGTKALDAADFTHAERACGGAYKLVNAPTGAVCWGRALEGLGKLVEARDAFLAAARFPRKPDEPDVFTLARAEGQAGADRLAQRIATLVFSVAGVSDSAPLRVAVDGVEITADTARLPRKVNPGRHVVLVASSGFRTARVEVTAAEGQEQRVAVQLHPLPPDEAGEAEPAAASAPSKVPAFITLGVGGVGVVVGTVFGVMALGDANSLKGQTGCPSSCPGSAQPQIDTLHRDQWLSDTGLAVGVVGLGIGAVLLLTSHSPEPATIGLDLGPGFVRLRGRF
jgi:hypothetical protein